MSRIRVLGWVEPDAYRDTGLSHLHSQSEGSVGRLGGVLAPVTEVFQLGWAVLYKSAQLY